MPRGRSAARLSSNVSLPTPSYTTCAPDAFGHVVDDGTEAVVADDVIGAGAEREFGLLSA